MDPEDSDDSNGPVSKTLVQYGGSTTIHGIPYILEEGRRPFERLLWIGLVIGGVWVACQLSIEIYKGWMEDPVVTSLSTTGYEIQNMEFPSITICGQGRVDEVIGKKCSFVLCLLGQQTKFRVV